MVAGVTRGAGGFCVVESPPRLLKKKKKVSRTRVMTENVTLADLASAEVELTCDEEALVEVLVEAAKTAQTTVRICGGWVRDKALGKVTKDIDVGVDNCTGAEFADRVANVASRGEVSRVGVIAANPEQSKHLETATMIVCGLEVDIVNLRSESYAEDSRVPTSVDFGTPLQDALRRDFTLNALFFNVHTRRIEDWTNKGWEDLRAGLLRTPLDARVTLLDDPLRALRGVRFAARYGFRLDETFRTSCRDAEVRSALLAKVSRERIGKELKGALASTPAAALRAVEELRSLDLASASLRATEAVGYSGSARGVRGARVAIDQVFAPDQSDSTSLVWAYAARAVAAHARLTSSYTSSEAWLVSLALTLSPLADGNALASKKTKNARLPSAVCRDGLKLPTRDTERVQKLLDSSHRCAKLADAWNPAFEPQARGSFRADAGDLLFELKDAWSDAIAVARARQLAEIDAVWDDQLNLDHPEARKVVAKFNNLQAALNDDLGLDNVWATYAPFFNGNELIQELRVPKGPRVGALLKTQREFQLANPDAPRDAVKTHLLALLDSPGNDATRRGRGPGKKRRT